MKMERVDTSPLRHLEKSKSHFERPTLKKALALEEAHRSRLDIISEQNRNLLGENKELRHSLEDKLRMLHVLEKKYDEQLDWIREMEQERQQFIIDVSHRNKINQDRIQQLLKELQFSRKDATQIQREWEIKTKESEVNLEKEMKRQLDRLSNDYARNINILKSENAKLKAAIDSNENKNSLELMENRNVIDRLKAELERAKKQWQHKEEISRVEAYEAKKNYEDKLAKMNLMLKRQKEVLLMEHESQRNRLQTQVDQLTCDIDQLRMQLEQAKHEQRNNQQESLNIQALLFNEVAELRHSETQIRLKQKQAQEGLWQEERQNLEKMHATQIALLSQQNTRLLALFQLNSEESANTREAMQKLRGQHREELQVYGGREKKLKDKMNLQDITNLEHGQVASTKMAILRAADLSSLRKYYQNEIQVLSSMILVKDAALQANREKVHAGLQSQTELRKYFQIQTSKYKAALKAKDVEIIELQSALKLKQHISREIGSHSQMEVHTDRQNRDKQAKWEDLRRLQAIIVSKDEEIDQLEQKLLRIKEMHQGHLKEKEQEHVLMEEKNTHLERQLLISKESSLAEIAKLKEGQSTTNQRHEIEISTLKAEHIAEVEKTLRDNQQQTATLREKIHDLLSKIRVLTEEHERLKVSSSLEKSQKEEAFALWQVSGTQGNREQGQKEDHFRDIIASKDCELKELREQLSEKESDLRDAKSNYYEMQQRMEQLMDSQKSLRELETKVMQLGLQNSSLFICDIE